MEQKKLQQFAQYVKASSRIVFFGGAGVSTASGIPDFRSKDGLYNQHDVRFEKYDPEYLLSRDCLFREPKVFYEFYRQKMDTRNIQPNAVHFALAKLEEMGKLSAIVTQNIDDLHQKAGSKKVYEIHGTTARNYCARCRKSYPSDYLFTSKEAIPHCDCGGQVRPDVTLYGESLPDKAVGGALKALQEADMLIIGGTSLRVYPAASFIYEFKGKHMVVINKEKLQCTLGKDDLVFEADLGEVFEGVLNLVGC